MLTDPENWHVRFTFFFLSQDLNKVVDFSQKNTQSMKESFSGFLDTPSHTFWKCGHFWDRTEFISDRWSLAGELNALEKNWVHFRTQHQILLLTSYDSYWRDLLEGHIRTFQEKWKCSHKILSVLRQDLVTDLGTRQTRLSSVKDFRIC